jgi:hypothetical protein
MLHGDRGQWYKHYTGVQQTDPLSPMLFILAMEACSFGWWLMAGAGLF